MFLLMVLFTKSGKAIYWYTYKQWASYIEYDRQKLIYEYQDQIDDPVVGGAVSCKLCKKVFEPDLR